jgi:hypothetical protein
MEGNWMLFLTGVASIISLAIAAYVFEQWTEPR